jgi:hypothetical protein
MIPMIELEELLPKLLKGQLDGRNLPPEELFQKLDTAHPRNLCRLAWETFPWEYKSTAAASRSSGANSSATLINPPRS